MDDETADPLASTRMSFGDHLEELRSRLIRAILGTLACFFVVFSYRDAILRFVVAPYREAASSMRQQDVLMATGPASAFFAYLKVSLVVALIVSAPIWMYQFWRFVGVGLYSKERKWIMRFAPVVFFLFGGGVWFGYTVLIPLGLNYLLGFADRSLIQNWIGLPEYLSLFTTLTLMLGVTFELPVLMTFFGRVGIFSVETYRAKRRYFIVGSLVVSALLTPPDVVTQILMAAPLAVLYELGIFGAWWFQDERGAVEWAKWRRRGLVLLGLIALSVVIYRPVIDYYVSKAIDDRYHTEDGGANIPYLEIFGRVDALGFEPDALYLLGGADGEDELWLAMTMAGDAIRPVRVSFYGGLVTKFSESKDGLALFGIQPGRQNVNVHAIGELSGKDLVPPLINQLEAANSETASRIDWILATLVGSRPDGAKALSVEADSDDRHAVLKAWRSWWSENTDWRWTARD